MRRYAQRHRALVPAARAVLLTAVITSTAVAGDDERVRPLTDLDGKPTQLHGLNTASNAKDADDPRPGLARIAYAPHLYPLLLGSGQDYTGAAKTFTRGAVDRWFKYSTDTARRLNAPMVLGEFGLDAMKPGALDYVDAVRERTREAGASWMYWSNDPGSWPPRRAGQLGTARRPSTSSSPSARASLG